MIQKTQLLYHPMIPQKIILIKKLVLIKKVAILSNRCLFIAHIVLKKVLFYLGKRMSIGKLDVNIVNID